MSPAPVQWNSMKPGVFYLISKVQKLIRDSLTVKARLLGDPESIDTIQKVAEKATDVFQTGHKILLAGNGGSAADAQHIAGEFVNKFCFDRPGLPAISLSTDTSVMTAIGNDSGFDRVFARQIQALGHPGDLFIGISTSGNSANILKALEECKKIGMMTVGMTGRYGGKMKELCDICIQAPSEETPRIQEVHILIAHIICAQVEEAIFKA